MNTLSKLYKKRFYNFGFGHKFYFDDYLVNLAGKPNLNVLEIGSYAGQSAVWFLQNILTDPTSRLTCLDTWDTERSRLVEKDFDLATEPYAGKVTKVKSKSFYWLLQTQDTKYDFIYIDGDHTSQGATLDLFGCFPLLKIGGLISVDDYNLKVWDNLPGVKPAVDLFLELMADKINVLKIGNQVWLEKVKD